MADIKPGDLYEIRVKGKWNDDYTITEGELADLCIKNRYEFDDGDAVHVERVGPPAEVFKPGDVVRRKHDGDFIALSQDGWINLNLKKFYGFNGRPFWDDEFTSENYEKVNLG